MAEHAHTTPTSYRLGRHPRRPDHPALLNPDGSVAHTFHKEAIRTEITAILAARGLAVHADGTVTQTAETPSTTRRTLLAGLAGAAATLAVIAPAPASENPDAVLLDLLAQFDALERQIFPGDPLPETIEAEDERDRAMAPLHARQQALLAQICSIRATTPAGWQARARSYLLWDNEMPKAIAAGDDSTAYYDDRMITALIRDMTQGAAA
jgi:hypothetical protein